LEPQEYTANSPSARGASDRGDKVEPAIYTVTIERGTTANCGAGVTLIANMALFTPPIPGWAVQQFGDPRSTSPRPSHDR
jgi:hypothetical protein